MTQGLIIDLFAGCGGASVGIERALGMPVDAAINHSEKAIACHALNHPQTRHLRGDVWAYAPQDVTQGAPVELLWASPTCTFFSKAKGGPLDRSEATKVRALAWVVNRWARETMPRTIVVENVEAFQFWGPLLRDGKACPKRRGLTFRRWVRELERLGYAVDWRELTASDYGAATSRKRLFVVATLDGSPRWPEPTHGPGRLHHRAAAEIIDWSLPVPSIFDRAKPYTEATLRRIAHGMQRFVLSGEPYFVGDDLAATMIQCSYGERKGQDPRCLDIQRPLGTVVAGGIKHALVVAFIAKHYGGNGTPGQSPRTPLGTVTCKDHHSLVVASGYGDRGAEVSEFMRTYGAQESTGSLFSPRVVIRDIGMRRLTPRELASAQGFPLYYNLGKTHQVTLIGNSVCPDVAEAVVKANVARAREVAA